MRIPILYLKMSACILSLSLLILFVAYQLGHRLGLLIGLIIATSWICLLWTSDERRWLKFFNVHRLKGQDSWGLLTKVEATARRLHMTAPEVYLVNSPSSFLLALSLGLPREILLVSRPVLQHFSDEEVESLIAAELTSLWLRRRFRYRWFHMLARSFVRLAELIDALLPWGRKVQVFTRSAIPVSQIFLKITLWNRFETERDEMSVSLLRDRKAFASAMWKLTSLAQVHPLKTPPGSEHLFLVSPNRTEDEGHLLRFHSPMTSRIRRILGADSI